MYFSHFLYKREPELMDDRQITALNLIQSELDNIRIAWSRLINQGKESELEQCWHTLFLFFQMRTKTIDGERIFDLAVKRFEQTESTLAGCFLMAWSWFVHWNGGSWSRNTETIQKGLRLLRTFGVAKEAALPLVITCLEKTLNDSYEEMRLFFRENLETFRNQGKKWGVGWTFYCLGQISWQTRKFDESEAYYRESIKSFKEMSNRWGLGWALGGLAVLFYDSEKYDQLQPLLQEHLNIVREIGDTGGIVWSLNFQGFNALRLKDFETAKRWFIQGLKIELEIGSHFNVSHVMLSGFLNLMIEEGKIDRAVELLGFLRKDAYRAQANRVVEAITRRLDTFANQLPSDVFQRAVERGKMLDLKTIGLQLLEEYSTAEKRAATTPSAIIQFIPDLLTERELQILRLVADGLQNQEIADQLFITLGTVKTHINAIYRKLDVSNRVQAISRARALKLLSYNP
jgi:DNA-binding CsgD family transcriptional regulator